MCEDCLLEKQTALLSKREEVNRNYMNRISSLEADNYNMRQIIDAQPKITDTNELDMLRTELSLLNLKLKEMELIKNELVSEQEKNTILNETINQLKIQLLKRNEIADTHTREDTPDLKGVNPDKVLPETHSRVLTPETHSRVSPRNNSPRGNSHKNSPPRGNSPRGNSPRGNLNSPKASSVSRGNEPRGNEPRGNEPRGNEPRVIREGSISKKSPRENMMDFKKSVENSVPSTDIKINKKKSLR